MATLKRKTTQGWETVTPAGDWPTPIPVQITEVDADLVPLTVTENGPYTPQAPHNGFSRVDVNVEGVPSVIRAGDMMVGGRFGEISGDNPLSTNWYDTGIGVTAKRSGTYRLKWYMGLELGSTVTYSRAYVNGSAVGTQKSATTENVLCTEDVSLLAGDVVRLWLKPVRWDSSYYAGWVSDLIVCIDGDNPFVEE